MPLVLWYINLKPTFLYVRKKYMIVFYSNVGLIAQYEILKENSTSNTRKERLSSIAVVIKEGKMPINCDSKDKEFLDALLFTKNRPLHLSEDDWSFRLFHGIKSEKGTLQESSSYWCIPFVLASKSHYKHVPFLRGK